MQAFAGIARLLWEQPTVTTGSDGQLRVRPLRFRPQVYGLPLQGTVVVEQTERGFVLRDGRPLLDVDLQRGSAWVDEVDLTRAIGLFATPGQVRVALLTMGLTPMGAPGSARVEADPWLLTRRVERTLGALRRAVCAVQACQGLLACMVGFAGLVADPLLSGVSALAALWLGVAYAIALRLARPVREVAEERPTEPIAVPPRVSPARRARVPARLPALVPAK
jgi:hypothetical protein